jgi:hypothetical protein
MQRSGVLPCLAKMSRRDSYNTSGLALLRAVDQAINNQQHSAQQRRRSLASAIQREVNRDRRIDLRRITIEKIRLISPLLHRIQRVVIKHRVGG